MSTRTRFEKEAKGNSEMAYCFMKFRHLPLLQSHTAVHSASCFDVFYNRVALFISIDSSDKF